MRNVAFCKEAELSTTAFHCFDTNGAVKAMFLKGNSSRIDSSSSVVSNTLVAAILEVLSVSMFNVEDFEKVSKRFRRSNQEKGAACERSDLVSECSDSPDALVYRILCHY